MRNFNTNDYDNLGEMASEHGWWLTNAETKRRLVRMKCKPQDRDSILFARAARYWQVGNLRLCQQTLQLTCRTKGNGEVEW